MGGEVTTQPPLWGALRDVVCAHHGVAGGDSANSSNGGDDGSNRMERGGEETEERRDNTPSEMTNWDRMVALARADLGEGLLSEKTM